MRLLPRHYLLIAIILAVGIYNLARLTHRRAPPANVNVALAPTAPPTSRPNTPAWSAFDAAAALRDAPDAQFQPALQTLNRQIDAAPSSTSADLDGCKTWLLFYRQGVLHPSADKSWQTRSAHHLDSCVQYHQDIAS